jgi:TolB protein
MGIDGAVTSEFRFDPIMNHPTLRAASSGPRFPSVCGCVRAAQFLMLLSSPVLAAGADGVGVFSSHSDVGAAGIPGTASFDAATGAYTVGGSGENMWAAVDAFQFVWSRVSGDVTLAADIDFLAPDHTPNAHRKACLIIRQSLEPDSMYADAALHGDGLTCLQFREAPGAPTRNVEARIKGPKRLRIEKRGKYVTMSVAAADGQLEPAGGSLRMEFTGSFYVGLAVCSHDNKQFEKAVFSNVELRTDASRLVSTLEVLDLASLNRRVLYSAVDHFEAPNWSPDGATIIFNRQGRLMRMPAAGGTPETIDTGTNVHCNNDHGISPDGTRLVISDQSENGRSMIYTLPIAGGTPTRVTDKAPSYWHGWSPDGKTLVYCADRNGNYDVYSIPVEGGTETRLTTAEGLDDGPEFSPDGKWIYFNSVRSGKMQIWRMHADGGNQERVTKDELNNWFAHPSPDGKWIVFITYDDPSVTPGDHPANKDVSLRLMPADGSAEPRVVARLFGGQGTINVPSWAPDSTKFAFVSYQVLP